MSSPYLLLVIPYLGNVYPLLVIDTSLFGSCVFPIGYWVFYIQVMSIPYWLLAIPYSGNVYSLLAIGSPYLGNVYSLFAICYSLYR